MASIGEHRADVAGTEVLWRHAEATTAAPTLYLHGVPTHGDDWIPFLERTGGIAPDLPGFGRSGKSAGFDYSIEGYAVFLRAFLEHLELERISMVVHDWGVVGLALAQEMPDAIDRLVVVNAVPFLPGYRWHRVARIWRTPLAGELFMGSSTRWAMKQTMRWTRALPPDRTSDFVDAQWPYFDHGTQRAILRLYRSAPSEVLAAAGERLGELRCPAQVLWGERDPFLPTRFAHGFAEALGGDARLDLIDAGHWPWIERPEVVDLIAEFLRG